MTAKVYYFPSDRSVNAPARQEKTWRDILRQRRCFMPQMWVTFMVADEATKEGIRNILRGWTGIGSYNVVVGAALENVAGYNWIVVDDRLPMPSNVVILPMGGVVPNFLQLSMQGVGTEIGPTEDFVRALNKSIGGLIDELAKQFDTDQPDPA